MARSACGAVVVVREREVPGAVARGDDVPTRYRRFAQQFFRTVYLIGPFFAIMLVVSGASSSTQEVLLACLVVPYLVVVAGLILIDVADARVPHKPGDKPRVSPHPMTPVERKNRGLSYLIWGSAITLMATATLVGTSSHLSPLYGILAATAVVVVLVLAIRQYVMATSTKNPRERNSKR